MYIKCNIVGKISEGPDSLFSTVMFRVKKYLNDLKAVLQPIPTTKY